MRGNLATLCAWKWRSEVMRAFFICPPRIIVTIEQFWNPSAYSERYFFPPTNVANGGMKFPAAFAQGMIVTSSHISTEILENIALRPFSANTFWCLTSSNLSTRQKKCSENFEFRSCYLSNVRRVDDRGKFGFVFEQCNSTLVCTVRFSLHINIFKTSLVWQLTFLKFNYWTNNY